MIVLMWSHREILHLIMFHYPDHVKRSLHTHPWFKPIQTRNNTEDMTSSTVFRTTGLTCEDADRGEGEKKEQRHVVVVVQQTDERLTNVTSSFHCTDIYRHRLVLRKKSEVTKTDF